MLITKKSPRTGAMNSREIPITQVEWDDHCHSGRMIQTSFSHLSADDREFLLSGLTPEDWAAIFGSNEEDM